jgi:hypothetical protein
MSEDYSYGRLFGNEREMVTRKRVGGLRPLPLNLCRCSVLNNDDAELAQCVLGAFKALAS